MLGLSSEAGAITFLSTVQLCRSSYGSMVKLDLVVWSVCIVSVLLITTLPILGSAVTLLFFERHLGGTAYGNGLDFNTASDALAFQHLFWFFGHPEVYVIILPAFGLISQ